MGKSAQGLLCDLMGKSFQGLWCDVTGKSAQGLRCDRCDGKGSSGTAV